MAVLASLIPSPSGLLKQLAGDLIAGFFRTLVHWVATGTIWLLGETWRFMSATTEPVLTGTAFAAEYHVMILIGAGSVLPLLGLAVIQAIARQDPGGLLRTALLRLPVALLLTGVVIELVSLGLNFTDEASVALLRAGGDPAARAFSHLEAALSPVAPGASGFGELLLVGLVALVGFLLWVELAVRSAAVAVATLFLPLALAGLVWPATSHWARRLGESLAGLVLMKLVMAAVLALAGGALAAGAGGISSVVEGAALLGLTALSPFVLFRLIPVVESGAVAHLEGARPAQAVKDRALSVAAEGAHWMHTAVTASGFGAAASSEGSAPSGLPGPGANPYGAAGRGTGRVAAGPDGSGAGGGSVREGSGVTGTVGAATAPRGEAGWGAHIARRMEGGRRDGS